MGDGAAVLGSLNILFLGLQPLYRNVAPGQCKCSSVTCDLSMRVGRAHLMICIDRVDLSYSTGDRRFSPPHYGWAQESYPPNAVSQSLESHPFTHLGPLVANSNH